MREPPRIRFRPAPFLAEENLAGRDIKNPALERDLITRYMNRAADHDLRPLTAPADRIKLIGGSWAPFDDIEKVLKKEIFTHGGAHRTREVFGLAVFRRKRRKADAQ